MSKHDFLQQPEDRLEVSAVPLMEILGGVYASKTLAAAVEFDLFTKISESGADFEHVAALLDLEARPAEMLVTGCAALGLLEKRDGRFYNSALAEKYLVKGKPEYFGSMIRMADQRAYQPWLHITEALKTNRALTWGDHPGLFEALSSNPDEQQMFIEGLHSVSMQSGAALTKALDLSGHRCMLDVGGGSGAYCIEVTRRYPNLRAVVFDIPAALVVARRKIAEAGLADRIDTRAGDFFRDELPKGSDLVLLSMILHDWTPEKNLVVREGL